MTNIGSLVANLDLESAAFLRDLGRAAAAVESNTFKMRQSMASVEKASQQIQGAFAMAQRAAAAFGVGLGVREIVNFSKASLDMADKIGKSAAALGLSTDALQEFRVAANLSGVGTDTFEKSIANFTRTVGDAQQGTGALVTQLQFSDRAFLRQIQSARGTEEALALIFRRLGATEDVFKRNVLAAAAFGREGVRMTNMVNGGIAGLDAMRLKAHELGLVLGEDLVKKGEAATDQIDLLAMSFRVGFARGSIDAVAKSFGDIETAIQKVNEAGEFMGRAVGDVMIDLRTETERTAAEFKGIIDFVERMEALRKRRLVEGQARLGIPWVDSDILRTGDVAGGPAGPPGPLNVNITVPDSVNKVVKSLHDQQEALRLSGRELFVYQQLLAANLQMGDPFADAVERAARAFYDEKQALDDERASWKAASDALEENYKAREAILAANDNLNMASARTIRDNEELIAALQKGTREYELQKAAIEARNAVIDAHGTQEDIDREVARSQIIVDQNRQMKLLHDTTAEYEDFASRAFDRVGNAITEMFVQGQGAAFDWRNVMLGIISEIGQEFIKLALLNPLKNELFGSNLPGLGGLLGMIGGGSAGFAPGSMGAVGMTDAFAFGFAEGTNSAPPGWAIVGEDGPELMKMRGGETVIPNRMLGGGPVFNVDMRGASVEAVNELRRLVYEVNGSIEGRSIAAVTKARARNPGLFGRG